MSTPAAPGRRRILERWRLVSPTGARVVSLRQLPKRERARLLAPSAFTTLNMMSGLSSVMLAFDGHFTVAAALIAVSIVQDLAVVVSDTRGPEAITADGHLRLRAPARHPQ